MIAICVCIETAKGHSPFNAVYLEQPVVGAPRGIDAEGWRTGRICNVMQSPYNARGDNKSDDTTAIQNAIDACGDKADGGTVILPFGHVFVSGSLWLRSNLTFRVNGVLMG